MSKHAPEEMGGGEVSDLRKLRELAQKSIESKPTGTGSEWRIHYDYEKATSPETVIALLDRIEKLEAKIERYETLLEAIRSQMCWERDRDQLTMGFACLHTSVTEALRGEKEGEP